VPRQIRLDQIDDYALDQIKTLVKVATLETDRRLKLNTPVDTGRLRASWQIKQEEFSGAVFNNLPYAPPVVAGVDLPPSWKGIQRTTPFLDAVAKDIQTYIDSEAGRIGRTS